MLYRLERFQTEGHSLRYGKLETKRGILRTTSADITTFLSQVGGGSHIISHVWSRGNVNGLPDWVIGERDEFLGSGSGCWASTISR